MEYRKSFLIIVLFITQNLALFSQEDIVTINELLIFDKSQNEYLPFSTSREKFTDKKITPLGIRYYNFGCIKTPINNWWDGQIDKDKYGHAIFNEAKWGILAFIKLTVRHIEVNKRNTPYKFMSIYAPPDDCIGSIRNPDGSCKYGKNPTKRYSEKIANSLGCEIHDIINLRDLENNLSAQEISILFSAIAQFELGLDCKITVDSIVEALKEYNLNE